MDQRIINLQSLVHNLTLQSASKQIRVSEDDLQFALDCLLQSFQASLRENPDWDYIQMKFNTAYNLLTGQSVLPS